MDFATTHKQLLEEEKMIIKLQYKCREKLNMLHSQLQENKKKIYENCIKHHGNHLWEAFREEGPYGERYFICKNCNTEDY